MSSISVKELSTDIKKAIEQLKSSKIMAATQGALMGVFAEARDQIESSIERVLADRMTVEEALMRAKVQTDANQQTTEGNKK